jgi:hypothetical protein
LLVYNKNKHRRISERLKWQKPSKLFFNLTEHRKWQKNKLFIDFLETLYVEFNDASISRRGIRKQANVLA